MKGDEKTKMSYEKLWKLIIRPDKDPYKPKDLGKKVFTFKGKTYTRKDYDLISSEGYIMKCSFIELDYTDRPKKIMPVILYLHGNSSSRLEGMGMLPEILKRDINLFVIDFPGCGQSEGEYISLGYHESHDVKIIVDFINKLPGVGNIGLWGRSMGAVTAIMYGDRDPSVAGMVLDSAFASLKELIEELVKSRVKLPEFILNQAVKLVKSTINKKAKFNLDEIEPKKYAVRCFIPALFCHANGDNFVDKHHCKDLSDVYAGDKNVVYVEGNHNSTRPKYFRDSAAIFFYNTLQCERIKEISDDYNGFKPIMNNNEEIKENNNKEENNLNNNNDDFNFQDFNNFNNENEELMLQQILELSLKEYEGKNKQNNDNININLNANNINNNLINNNIPQNNNIINNENNNIINENEINNNIIGNNEINNPNKGLFNDLNPVPLQNHEKNVNMDLKGP